MSDMTELIAQSLQDNPPPPDENNAPINEPEGVIEEQPPAPNDAEKAEEEELTKIQADLVAKNPNLRGKIDVPRHQAVVTRLRNQHEKQLAEARAFQEKYEKLKWAEDEGVLKALEALSLAETDQKRFAEALLKDERFSKLLQFIPEQPQTPPQAEERPTPNKLTEDGKFQYYDDEGIEQLLAWHGSKIEKMLTEKFEKMYGPIRNEFESRNLWNQRLEKARERLELARQSWDGFRENEDAIKAYMAQNKKADIDDAYRAVVVKKLKDERAVNEEELRKKIIAELKLKPAAAKGSENDRTKPEVKGGDDEGGRVSVKDIIKANLPRE